MMGLLDPLVNWNYVEDDMRRYLAIIIIGCFVLLCGCALPTGGNLNTSEGTTEVTGTTNQETGQVKETSGSGVQDVKSESNNNSVASGTAMIPVTIYYQDADGYLVPMTRWVDKQPGIANAAVSGLIDSAITREELQYFGVYPVLPINTDILGINIKEGIATVDFSKQLLDYDNADIESNIVTSVVYTLTEFSTISSVRILINGFPVDKLTYGTDISKPLSRSDLPINGKVSAGEAKAEIYCFKKANEGFTYLLPVSVKADSIDVSNAGTLVKLLLNGESDEKIQSEIPENSEVLGYSIKNGVLVLDFNSKFIEYGGNAREEGILKQIVYTVRQVKGISLVKLTVNGKSVLLPEGTDISSGIAIPKTINDFIDR
jgi:Spore germination protein